MTYSKPAATARRLTALMIDPSGAICTCNGAGPEIPPCKIC